jgi:hypothetical protein
VPAKEARSGAPSSDPRHGTSNRNAIFNYFILFYFILFYFILFYYPIPEGK